MKATLNILLMIFLGLSISYCSSSPKNTEEQPAESSSNGDYNSSSTYDDLKADSGDEEVSTGTDYGSDDSYGSAGDDASSSGGSDDLFMGGTDDDSSPAPSNDPLPIERIEEDSAPVVDTPSSGGSGFKDGFYVIAKNCNMRADASSKSANEGKVQAGKRLWVEGHNSGWVKVFKKSGPVYLSKSCL